MAEGLLNSLRNFWRPDINAFLWLILAIPGLLFFQTTVHEGTHALIAYHENGDFPKLFPFMHGDFRIGVTIPDKSETYTEHVKCDPKVPPIRHSRLAGFIGWPQVLDLILIVIFTTIFLLWNLRNSLLAFIMRAWYIAACIDFLFNAAKILIGICDEGQDWARVMIRSDINHFLFWLLTFVLCAAVLSHFLWVRWTKWADDPPEETSFSDYRWIALFLGLMSALALLVAWVVSDPTIDKNGLFVFEVVLQFIGLIFYGIYFWWAVTHKEAM